jgi:hypothetical protein
LELRGNLHDWKLTGKGQGGKLIHGVAETKSWKKERQSKRGCLVLFSTIFNISDLLVDKFVNSYQKSE